MKAPKHYRAHFKNVGREKRSWTKTYGSRRPADDTLEAEIKRSGALMSLDVWLSWPDDEHAFIRAGMHSVGTVEIVEVSQ